MQRTEPDAVGSEQAVGPEDAPGPDAATGSKLGGLLLRLLLSLTVLLVFGALAEWALWAVEPRDEDATFRFREVPGTIAREDVGRYEIHPERFFTTAADYRFKPSHLGRYATGSWPFRGRPAEPAPPGMARIAVIGDSCIYGASLDVSAGLSHGIARGLARHGLGPDRVAVLTFGVPGYSTFQLRSLLDDVLDRYEPTAVVLYPAAWNDQGPALRASDAELFRQATDPTLLGYVDRRSRLVAAVRGLFGATDGTSEREDDWRQRAQQVERRVSPTELEGNLRAMCVRLREAGVPTVVMSAAHPAITRTRSPEVVQDAQAVRRVAAEMGLPVLDGQQILDGATQELASLFVDYVHPSPDGSRLLADSIVTELVRGLEHVDIPVPGTSLRIESVRPTSASTFGDDPVTVELSGWSRDEPLPAVIIAGAPLLDLHASAEHAVTGTLMANGPGQHDVVVQSATGCAVLEGGFELIEPRLSVECGATWFLLLHARPGDRARVVSSTALRSDPAWSNRGAYWLSEKSKRIMPIELVADENGVGRLQLPAEIVQFLTATGRLYLQALVYPRGETEPMGPASRWSPLTVVTPD